MISHELETLANHHLEDFPLGLSCAEIASESIDWWQIIRIGRDWMCTSCISCMPYTVCIYKSRQCHTRLQNTCPQSAKSSPKHAHRTTSRNGLKHFRHFSMLKLTRHGHPTYLVPVVRFHSLSLRCTIYTTSKYTPLYPEQYAPHVDLYLPVFYIRDNPLAGPTGVT